MSTQARPSNVVTLKHALSQAEQGGYALGSFSPRVTPMIRPVLRAGEKAGSPLIVQISQKELERYGVTPARFGEAFFRALCEESITVPVVLHLDHTKTMSVIGEAIAAGFTSVMIDASDQPLAENIRISREAASHAHSRGVSVEAELGRIGTTDFIETDTDEQMYTDPEEAGRFVRETGIDALAVSVGTAHGVYRVKKPAIDYDRLQAIRARTDVALVLHGGSGIPAEMVRQAIRLPGGGVSKVNIATDLERAWLAAIGFDHRMTDAECRNLPEAALSCAQAAVERTVVEKMEEFLGSAGRAAGFRLQGGCP